MSDALIERVDDAIARLAGDNDQAVVARRTCINLVGEIVVQDANANQLDAEAAHQRYLGDKEDEALKPVRVARAKAFEAQAYYSRLRVDQAKRELENIVEDL